MCARVYRILRRRDQVPVRQHGDGGAVGGDVGRQVRPAPLVREAAHVLAAARLVPLLRRVGARLPPRAPRQRQHRLLAARLRRLHQAARRRPRRRPRRPPAGVQAAPAPARETAWSRRGREAEGNCWADAGRGGGEEQEGFLSDYG